MPPDRQAAAQEGDVKLYDSGRAPNPRRVRIFLAEKGIAVPSEQVDIAAQEHKSPDFTALNPLQRVPVLVLDDGTVIAESIAICRYFERLRPEPPLFGRGPKEEALVEMWNRRMELNLLSAVSSVFRHTHPAMKELETPQVPEWAEANKPRVSEFLDILDGELKDQLFIVGRSLERRRYHRPGGDRFHEARGARRAGGVRQRAPLARPGLGSAEREGVKKA